MEKLWTTSETAKCLGITDVDVEQLAKEGKLTGYRLGGKFLRFRPEQVISLKDTINFRPTKGSSKIRSGDGWFGRSLEFCYLYDFYVVSAVLLTGVVVYLLVTG